MGFSISWIAVRASPDVALSLLGLARKGEELDDFEAPLSGGQLRTDWFLVVADRCDHILISDAVLAQVSEKAHVVACSVEEHVMASRAEYWSHGHKNWSLSHDAQRANRHLDVAGNPPADFAEVRDRLLAQQDAEDPEMAEVDYVFDVPLETAHRITGFKHDVVGDPTRFAVLSLMENSVLSPRRPWWKFW